MTPQTRRSIDVAMLVLTVAASVAIVVNAAGPVRWPLVFGAILLVPGSALMSLIPVSDVGAYLGLTVALSIAAEVIGSTVMVWLGWWHPIVLGGLIAVASCIALAVDLRSVSRGASGKSMVSNS